MRLLVPEGTVDMVSLVSASALIAAGLAQPATSELLELVNRKVAAIFGQGPKALRVEFYHMPQMVLESYLRRAGFILGGTCAPKAAEPIPVALLLKQNWRHAFVHELVHIYNPEASERAVRRKTRQAIELLKRNAAIQAELMAPLEAPA